MQTADWQLLFSDRFTGARNPARLPTKDAIPSNPLRPPFNLSLPPRQNPRNASPRNITRACYPVVGSVPAALVSGFLLLILCQCHGTRLDFAPVSKLRQETAMEKPEGARRVPPWKFWGQMTGVVTAM